MVVIAVSITSKSGKALVSRQYVDMTRTRIEGLLAAFIKLVEAGKQHTYVEAESVRFVYQPIESLYLLLITNRQSNILEDLETLRVLSKLVPEYSVSLDEDGICKTAFDLIFAFDEVMSLGHKENVTVAQVKQYCEMESHEERLHKLVMQNKIDETKDVMKRKASEIDKTRIEKNRSEKGGFMSLQSMGSSRIESGFGSDMSISSSGTGFGNGSGYGLSTDVESFSSKPKGHPLSSATAPPKGLGMQLGKTQKANQFLESLKAEGEVILEDVRPSAGLSRSAAPPLTDPITLSVEEKLNVTLKRDGGVSNFDVQGTLSLQILNQEDGLIQVQIETGGNPGILFKTHPNINKELFSNENILGLKDSNRPFPTGQSTDGVGLLKWRMQSVDESVVPLTINCWPSVSGNETYVSIEYEASSMFDLQNVVISVPLPALREAPSVRQIDGEWRYDSRYSILAWSILLIDNSNRSGSMEFVVPPADSSVFFPISVRFTAANTFSDLKVTNILPLRGGPSPKFSLKPRIFSRKQLHWRHNHPIRAQNSNHTIDDGFELEDVPHLTNFLPDLPSYPNPLHRSQAYAIVKKTFVSPEDVVAHKIVVQKNSPRGVHFRRAGPRERVYFNSEEVRACIVTCGGLCPGINTVIREIVCGLNYMYGVDDILGIEGGYRGFYSKNTMQLMPKTVNDIHKRGGTILRTSRGGHDTNKIVDNIQDRGINQVYIIGGDGTQKGAAAIYKEVEKRGLKVAVAGIPKTIDNDIAVIDKSFGFDTAVEEAQRAINAAHVEVESVENGVGIVKLMGRYSGFIAMIATLASRDVDCCLIPESPFYLEGQGGLFEFVEQRLKENGHMVIVLAEGAGQEYVAQSMHVVDGKDASGNRLLLDVGLWLTQKIKDHFMEVQKMPINLKYIDPTYMIRAIPSNASDNVYCTLLAQSAVHGAMAGYTGFTVGPVNSRHAYIPIARVTETQNIVKLTDRMWARLLASTNQPSFLHNSEMMKEKLDRETLDVINEMKINSI